MTRSFSAFCTFSDVHVDASPIEVQRADALYDFLHMPTNAGNSGSTLSGKFWRERLDDISGTLELPLERRVSLMLTTMLVAAVGANRDMMGREEGRSARSIRQPRSVLQTALLDELLLVTGLARLLQMNLRAKPCAKTPRNGCIAEWSWRLRCTLHTREPRAPRLERRRKKRATCTMDVQPPYHLL